MESLVLDKNGGEEVVLKDSASAIEALKEVVDQQGNLSLVSSSEHKRPGEEDKTPEKRPKLDLGTLADATAGSTVNTQPVVSSSFNFVYPYNTLNSMVYYSQGSLPLESDQYQQMMLQQPGLNVGYFDRMRVNGHPEDESTLSPRPKGRTKSIHISPSQTAAAYATGQYTGRFVLLEQPNVRQRKSYKNENRYVLPNPLTICAREETPGEKLQRIVDGQVTCSLVNADGNDLPMNKNNLLESPEGGLVQHLDSNLSAHFSLKVLDTSEGSMFRLLFTINYSLDNLGQIEEKILSRPFQVYSNRKKNLKGQERPLVVDMKPNNGMASQETEVWIKGRGFSDRVNVFFGDRPGRIVETTDNLITVIAPQRFDFITDTSVQVVVSNKYPHDMMNADKKLNFIYYNG